MNEGKRHTASFEVEYHGRRDVMAHKKRNTEPRDRNVTKRNQSAANRDEDVMRAPGSATRGAEGDEGKRAGQRTDDEAKRQSGLPGGGQGRRDTVGESGVFPASGGTRPGGQGPDPNAEPRSAAAWGQGDRGAAGYDDSGGSELVMRDGELLGGLTAGASGEPTIDIHGGDRGENDLGRREDSEHMPVDREDVERARRKRND
jgi:hypothetical protein